MHLSCLPKVLSAIKAATKPKVSIQLEDERHTYTSHDRIRGTATITVAQDTSFDEIEISLIGTAETFIERLNTCAVMASFERCSREFISRRQPALDQHYPVDRTLRAGQTYVFPFHFAIPETIEADKCCHFVLNAALEEAHLRLPPTFGDRGVPSIGRRASDNAPEGATVKYRIHAKIVQRSLEKEFWKDLAVATSEHAIRLLPLARSVATHDLDQNLCKHLSVRHVVHREYVGAIVASAQRLEDMELHISPNGVRHNDRPLSILIMLHYDGHHGTDYGGEPPQLKKLSSKLKTYTCFSTKPYEDWPSISESKHDTSKALHGRTLELASRDTGNLHWHVDRSGSFASSATSSNCAEKPLSLISADSSTGPSYVAELLVPIELPKDRHVAPTFDSCLISHFHLLEISLSFGTGSGGDTVKLRVPLRVTVSSTWPINYTQYQGEGSPCDYVA